MKKQFDTGLKVKLWLDRFKQGLVINEVRINREAAVSFFGAFPVMRENIFELYGIAVARQILSLSETETKKYIAKIRKSTVTEKETLEQKEEPRDNERKPLIGGAITQTPSISTCFTGSIVSWEIFCPDLCDPGTTISQCVDLVRKRAMEVLKRAHVDY